MGRAGPREVGGGLHDRMHAPMLAWTRVAHGPMLAWTRARRVRVSRGPPRPARPVPGLDCRRCGAPAAWRACTASSRACGARLRAASPTTSPAGSSCACCTRPSKRCGGAGGLGPGRAGARAHACSYARFAAMRPHARPPCALPRTRSHSRTARVRGPRKSSAIQTTPRRRAPGHHRDGGDALQHRHRRHDGVCQRRL